MWKSIVVSSLFSLTACGSVQVPNTSKASAKRPTISGYDENHNYVSCDGLFDGEMCGKTPTEATEACRYAKFDVVYCKDCQTLCTGDVIIN